MAQKPRLVLGFVKYTDQQLAVLAAAVLKGMTGNKAFNPPGDLAVVQSALEDFNAALAATIQGGPAATVVKNAKRQALIDLLEKLGHYVQTHSNNDHETLISSGFETIAPRTTTITLPARPTIFGVNNGNTTELSVKVVKQPNAKFYELRSAAVDDKSTPGEWQQNGFSSKSRVLVKGLKPGTNYVFQVRAMGTAGFSDWSDPVAHLCW